MPQFVSKNDILLCAAVSTARQYAMQHSRRNAKTTYREKIEFDALVPFPSRVAVARGVAVADAAKRTIKVGGAFLWRHRHRIQPRDGAWGTGVTSVTSSLWNARQQYRT